MSADTATLEANECSSERGRPTAPALRSDTALSASTSARLAEQVAEQARQQVPVDSGRLRDSITVEMGSDAQGLWAEVRADTPYAGIVERRTAFLTNAAQQVLGTNAVREFVRGATEQARREVRQSQRRS